MFMDDRAIIDAQRESYRANFLIHRDAPQGTYQNDLMTQHIRYASLLRHIRPHFEEGTTVEDLGAGVCDLYDYLRMQGLDGNVTYSATEIVQEMVDCARAKYPTLEILNRNFLDVTNEKRYEFVVLSGALNLLGGVGEVEWKRMCFALIEKMFALASKGIAFNFLTSYRTFSDERLCYFDPREMFEFSTLNLSRFVHLDAGCPLYECTITVFQKNFIRGRNPQPDLEKYFADG
jgi:hypothetical protein